MKYIFIFLFFIILLFAKKLLAHTKRQTIFLATDRLFVPPYNAHEIVILWDIHGVIFKKNIIHWFLKIIASGYLFSAIRKLDWATTGLLLKYVGKKFGLLSEEITNQEFLNCASRSKNQALINLTIKISCEYKLNKSVFNLIEHLNRKGYVQHIGSNIGKDVFEKFALQHHAVFQYFTAIHIINTKESHTFNKKPNQGFFYNYLQKYAHELNGKQIIFIDDQLQNVLSAQFCGINAILFCHINQLKQDLDLLLRSC